jgi:peptide/nickel transport system ATP-binding protein
VNGADLDVSVGECVAIVGESGSGKTTLALAAAGLLTAQGVVVTADRMRFAGRDRDPAASRTVPHRIAGLSMVFQDAMTSLDPVAKVGAQFRAVLRGIGVKGRTEVRERTADWLRRVGLHEHERVVRARPHELSGGMRQRVMLALAMCSEPQLLVADEPTSALDASVSREVMDLLREVTRSRGTALLIVTHDVELCRRYADRVVVMLRGDVVDDCPTAQIDAPERASYTRNLLRCVPTLTSAGWHRLPTLSSEAVQQHPVEVVS